MINKKQPLTKQFLLSFKTGHGDFYQKFVNLLRGKAHFCRRVKQDETCPSYMTAQKCLFMCILQKKHIKFFNQQLQISQLSQILKKHRAQILKSVSSQKNSTLRKANITKIEQIQNTIIQVVTRQNFAFNSFQLTENTYIYQLFKAIFSRSQEISLFGEPKYDQMGYSYLQVKQLSAIFGENIVFFDYNASKNMAANIQFNFQTTYVLKVKDKYAILYVKQPKYIEIIREGTFPLTQVEAIFSIQHPKPPTQQAGFFDRLLGLKQSDAQSLRQSSKLFPNLIECSNCQNKLSQFDCLKWNYEHYCGNCLQNPQFDTSHIPSTLIEKYFRQRGIKHRDYQISCAQCSSITHLRKYNPANKPQKYICQVCQHTICLEHNANINECFCQCKLCRHAPTINIIKLNLAVCDSCKLKFCRTCKMLSEQLCPCICILCNQLNKQGHTCKERCHVCQNHINNVKICACGGKICYGCYYNKLTNNINGKSGPIICKGRY